MLAGCLEIIRLGYHLAVTIAYTAAIAVSFLANRTLTFKARGGRAAAQLIRFLVCAGLNYLLTLAIVTLGVEVINLNAYWSVLISLLITTPVGFVLFRNWVFQTAKG